MKVSLKTITPNAEVNIVEIARVSSSRTDKAEKPEGLINYLIKNKHWSPFQHSYLTYEIVTSKAIAIQLLRHLSFTFQEFSQRYAKVEKLEDVQFRLQADKNRQSSTLIISDLLFNPEEGMYVEIKEESIALQHTELKDWSERVAIHLNQGLDLYDEGIDLGVAKETARMILPMCTQTTLYMTGSLRSWIHFLQIRLDPHAQKEVQLIAADIRDIFIEQCPIISKALKYED